MKAILISKCKECPYLYDGRCYLGEFEVGLNNDIDDRCNLLDLKNFKKLMNNFCVELKD